MNQTFNYHRLLAGGAALSTAAASMKMQPSARRALVAGGITFVVGLFALQFRTEVKAYQQKAAERAEER